MKFSKVGVYIQQVFRIIFTILQSPHYFLGFMNTFPRSFKAHKYARSYRNNLPVTPSGVMENPLWNYFESNTKGNGIWKWEQYFDMYQRHLEKFVNQEVKIVEVGIFSGGSLEMWRNYFGAKCTIYGVDIEPECKTYENDYTKIIIGDQEDREFWKDFIAKYGPFDILIDDGGHTPNQQQVTLEMMLPNIKPGGVYICEDIQNEFNEFSGFATSLVRELNGFRRMEGGDLQSHVNSWQKKVHSMHFYPYALVIENHNTYIDKLVCPRKGTVWQPFL